MAFGVVVADEDVLEQAVEDLQAEFCLVGGFEGDFGLGEDAAVFQVEKATEGVVEFFVALEDAFEEEDEMKTEGMGLAHRWHLLVSEVGDVVVELFVGAG